MDMQLCTSKPIGATTFAEYAEKVFIPYVTSQKSSRIEVIWDEYKADSLKCFAREKRGIGTRRLALKQIQRSHQTGKSFLRLMPIRLNFLHWSLTDLLLHKVKRSLSQQLVNPFSPMTQT